MVGDQPFRPGVDIVDDVVEKIGFLQGFAFVAGGVLLPTGCFRFLAVEVLHPSAEVPEIVLVLVADAPQLSPPRCFNLRRHFCQNAKRVGPSDFVEDVAPVIP